MAKLTSPAQRRYASIAEAAEYVGLHDRTIRRWILDGRLTGYRLGTKLLRVDLNEVDRLFKPVTAAGDAG